MVISRIELHDTPKAMSYLSKVAMGDPYYYHKLMWQIFSADSEQKRNFLFRCEHQSRPLHFIAVSELPPVDRDGVWRIETKDYAPKLRQGQDLFFVVSANAVVSTLDAEGRVKRSDIVMYERKKLERKGVPRTEWAPREVMAFEQGYEWIKKRSERLGFTLEPGNLRIDGYRQQRFFKHKGRHTVQINTLDMKGRLTVTDPAQFTDMLYRGLGPAKAFGCGLMLIRPA